MICPNCKSPYFENTHFCEKCGHDLFTAESILQEQNFEAFNNVSILSMQPVANNTEISPESNEYLQRRMRETLTSFPFVITASIITFNLLVSILAAFYSSTIMGNIVESIMTSMNFGAGASKEVGDLVELIAQLSGVDADVGGTVLSSSLPRMILCLCAWITVATSFNKNRDISSMGFKLLLILYVIMGIFVGIFCLIMVSTGLVACGAAAELKLGELSGVIGFTTFFAYAILLVISVILGGAIKFLKDMIHVLDEGSTEIRYPRLIVTMSYIFGGINLLMGLLSVSIPDIAILYFLSGVESILLAICIYRMIDTVEAVEFQRRKIRNRIAIQERESIDNMPTWKRIQMQNKKD